jgi:hypothetical protein
MIKEFYSNPGTFEPEVKEAFAFPEQAVMKKWAEDRHLPTQGPLRTFLNNPQDSLVFFAILGGVGVTSLAMGPHGEAMKIIKNKKMSATRYFGLRAIPFALGSFALYSLRSRVDYSNPYSRGELK